MHGVAGIAASLVLVNEARALGRNELCVKIEGFHLDGEHDESDWIVEARRVTPNDRVEGRDAASARRVPSHDGLEG
jgi:hypothetical protein